MHAAIPHLRSLVGVLIACAFTRTAQVRRVVGQKPQLGYPPTKPACVNPVRQHVSDELRRQATPIFRWKGWGNHKPLPSSSKCRVQSEESAWRSWYLNRRETWICRRWKRLASHNFQPHRFRRLRRNYASV